MFNKEDIYLSYKLGLPNTLSDILEYKELPFYTLLSIKDLPLFLQIDKYEGYRCISINYDVDDSELDDLYFLIDGIPLKLLDNNMIVKRDSNIYLFADMINMSPVNSVRVIKSKNKNECYIGIGTSPARIFTTTFGLDEFGLYSKYTSTYPNQHLIVSINLPSMIQNATDKVVVVDKHIIKESIYFHNGKDMVVSTDKHLNNHVRKPLSNGYIGILFLAPLSIDYYERFINTYKSKVVDNITNMVEYKATDIMTQLYHLYDLNEIDDVDIDSYILKMEKGIFDKLYNDRYKPCEDIINAKFKGDMKDAFPGTTIGASQTFVMPRLYFTIDNINESEIDIFINGKFIHNTYTAIRGKDKIHYYISLSQIYNTNLYDLIEVMANKNVLFSNAILANFSSLEDGINILSKHYRTNMKEFIDLFGELIITDMKICVYRRFGKYDKFHTGLTPNQINHTSIPDVINMKNASIYLDGNLMKSDEYYIEKINGVNHIFVNKQLSYKDVESIPLCITEYKNDVVIYEEDVSLTDNSIDGLFTHCELFSNGFNINHSYYLSKVHSSLHYIRHKFTSADNKVKIRRYLDVNLLKSLSEDYVSLMISALSLANLVKSDNSLISSVPNTKSFFNKSDMESFIVYMKYILHGEYEGTSMDIDDATIAYIKSHYPNVAVDANNNLSINTSSFPQSYTNSFEIDEYESYKSTKDNILDEKIIGDISKNLSGVIVNPEMSTQKID